MSQGTALNASENVAVNGFFLQASDLNGVCIPGSASVNNFKTERLDFNKYTTMSCSVSFKSEADFRSYCEKGDAAKLKIFAQLGSINKIGVFGNASPAYNDDWLTVINQSSQAGYFVGTYDAGKKSCTLNSSAQLEIVTSVTGFQLRPQSFVAGAQISGVKDTWYWPGTSPTLFTHFLSVNFRQAIDNNQVDNAQTVAKTIANDLFYPLNIGMFK